MPNPNLKIVVEENIPFLRGLLDRYASVKYLPSGAIDAKAVADADAIIVRTRTRCDAALLAGSRCKLVATATIGTDHIDLPWCAQHNITVVNAPGCNAPAVAQYVFASLLAVVNRPLADLTIGIVGIGHVGSIVENWARSLGMRVMLCDPPRQLAEGGDHWHTLDEIASRADIVTFHVPLTVDGDHPTHHLIGSGFLDSLRRAPVIINSSRGAVADTAALLRAAKTGKTINIKKGQFLSPLAMRFAADKVVEAGNRNVMLTERGTTFGYQDLVIDYRGIPEMQTFGFPVILDVTHSLQQPNQTSGVTGGMPQLIETVAKAGVAVGVDGLFIETHENPAVAKSDGANMLKLDLLEDLLTKLVRIRKAVR